MNIAEYIRDVAQRAHLATAAAAHLLANAKNDLLMAMAERLVSSCEAIKKENLRDIENGQKKGLSKALIDRLTLNDDRIAQMAEGLQAVVNLQDPVGHVAHSWERPNGLIVKKVRIPLGVIAIIYESRPNVTVDAASLCIKAGNTVILRGGSEAIHSNQILATLLQETCKAKGINPDIIQLIKITDREGMMHLVKQTEFIDLVIPRGGEALMKWMEENSRIPFVKHDKGICHVYVDDEADLNMALEIAYNSKVQRPGVCNAMETLLVHEKIARKFLPLMAQKFKTAEVQLKGCPKTREILSGIESATEEDWSTEYLDLILSIKTVSSMEEAIEHIWNYGSLHTEVIVTQNEQHANHFLKVLDSSMVGWNCSTRFNDGGQLGLGSEIGISTTKLHAFGPMGVEELTAEKFVVVGKGQIRTR